MTFNRRGLLRYLGLTAAGVATVSACSEPDAKPQQPSPAPEPKQPVEPPVLGDEMPLVRSEYVFSEARGTNVALRLVYPSGLDSTENLPMVVYLHGKGGIKPTPMPFQTMAALELEHRKGAIEPFGFVTVDGGFNPYWTDGSPNGDLLTMLIEELPGWLSARGLGDADGVPVACAGISTGGFGAMHYAIERSKAGQPVARAAQLAPAIPLDWEQMQERDAFDTVAAWRAADPLQNLDELGDVPVGVWVGDEDPYRESSERLRAGCQNVPVFSVLPGGHDSSVFDVVGVDMVHFLSAGIA